MNCIWQDSLHFDDRERCQEPHANKLNSHNTCCASFCAALVSCEWLESEHVMFPIGHMSLMHVHAHAHTRTRTYTVTLTQHAHACTHTRTRTHAHAHTHTHRQTNAPRYERCVGDVLCCDVYGLRQMAGWWTSLWDWLAWALDDATDLVDAFVLNATSQEICSQRLLLRAVLCLLFR